MISIVDDDAAVRDALWRLMDSAGLKAEMFASAEDFLDRSCLPDTTCLILDVRLPGMSGLELQRRLTASHRDLPIILISGHADDELRGRALEAGAVDFFEKPFSNDALLEAVGAARAGRALSPAGSCGRPP